MNHGKMILEACVDSPESAEAAEKGGACLLYTSDAADDQ